MTDLPESLDSLVPWLLERGALLATAESCTGGLVAVQCTERPGSSQWFDRAYVTYSNSAKTELLGVPPTLIAQHGAVSEAVVRAMAAGAVLRSDASLAVAISGVAGPDGGSEEKPVGTVWLGYALALGGNTALRLSAECCHFDGDRAAVRQGAATAAIQGLLVHAKNTG